MSDTALKRKPDYSRLSRAELNSLFALHRQGKNQVEIAQVLGCSVPTVSRWLATLQDSTELAKQTLKASADTVAQRLVKTNHAPTMLEVLRDLGVSEKKAPAGEQRGGITVVIGVQAERVQLGGFASPVVTVSEDLHRLTADTGSDN